MLTESALLQMYYALVYPNIIYCQTVWGSAGSVVLKQLVTSQKRVIRTIKGARRYEHTNSIFLDLNILKLEDVNIYCCAIYVYKSLNNITENKYFTYRVNEFHSLRNADLLRLPAVRSTQSKRYINYHGVEIWNSLPPNIRNKTSIQSFKIALKKYLLNRYDNNENT